MRLGSDVNSMDSVDSGCTMGVSEGNHAASPASELVIWEVEVPKVSVWGGVGGGWVWGRGPGNARPSPRLWLAGSSGSRAAT